jgi:hypothetical protein
MRHQIFFLAWFVLSPAATIFASDQYVNCSLAADDSCDGNGDGTSTTPWRSICHAARVVPSSTATVHVMNGPCREDNILFDKPAAFVGDDSGCRPRRVRGRTRALDQGPGRHPVPIMLLARLAVARSWQGKACGAGLLKGRHAAHASGSGYRRPSGLCGSREGRRGQGFL